MYFEKVYDKIFIRQPHGLGKEVNFTPTNKTAEALKNWAILLINGAYEQGQDMLKYYSITNKQHVFCCLGVLGEANNLFSSDYTDAIYLTAYQFKKILALESYRNFQKFFAYLNDDQKFSFTEIAEFLTVLAAFLDSPETIYFLKGIFQ